MYPSFSDIVKHAPRDETLHPGDVLGSGTVRNCCCLDLDCWIEDGNTIELAITGLCPLDHRIDKSDRS